MLSNSYLLALPAFSSHNSTTILSSTLTNAEAAILKNLAAKDAAGLWYSGAVSLAQGFTGINQKRYGWSTVKLYYASYYFLRAFLLSAGWCQFYVSGKPRAIEARTGKFPEKLSGTSHESCYRLFANVYPRSSLISQNIAVDTASDWMKHKREEINYNNPRFPDPDPPPWFEIHASQGVRKMLISYLDDPLMYAFLPDHAMLAYPIAAGIEACSALRGCSEFSISEFETKGLTMYWRDKDGQLPGIERLVPI
jgi:hypothetical protein